MMDLVTSRVAGISPVRNSRMKIAYPALDYAKLLMAFLVVEIHTKPLMSFGNEIINRIAAGIDCVAVPFFFIASGFLCFRGLDLSSIMEQDSNASRRVRATIKKLAILYTTWFVLLLPLDIIGHVAAGHSFIVSIAYEIRGFLLVGEGYYSWPLWYLLASVVAFAITYLMLRGGGSPRPHCGSCLRVPLGGICPIRHP